MGNLLLTDGGIVYGPCHGWATRGKIIGLATPITLPVGSLADGGWTWDKRAEKGFCWAVDAVLLRVVGLDGSDDHEAFVQPGLMLRRMDHWPLTWSESAAQFALGERTRAGRLAHRLQLPPHPDDPAAVDAAWWQALRRSDAADRQGMPPAYLLQPLVEAQALQHGDTPQPSPIATAKPRRGRPPEYPLSLAAGLWSVMPEERRDEASTDHLAFAKAYQTFLDAVGQGLLNAERPPDAPASWDGLSKQGKLERLAERLETAVERLAPPTLHELHTFFHVRHDLIAPEGEGPIAPERAAYLLMAYLREGAVKDIVGAQTIAHADRFRSIVTTGAELHKFEGEVADPFAYLEADFRKSVWGEAWPHLWPARVEELDADTIRVRVMGFVPSASAPLGANPSSKVRLACIRTLLLRLLPETCGRHVRRATSSEEALQAQVPNLTLRAWGAATVVPHIIELGERAPRRLVAAGRLKATRFRGLVDKARRDALRARFTGRRIASGEAGGSEPEALA